MNIEDITLARTILILTDICNGGLSAYLIPLEDSTILDIETDGRHLKYNPDVKISAEELVKRIKIAIESYLDKESNGNYEKFKELSITLANHEKKNKSIFEKD